MAGTSTWSASLLDPCYNECGKLGEFWMQHQDPDCPGPNGQGPGRVVLCRDCKEEACPFCGQAIPEEDLRSVTDKLLTQVTTCSKDDEAGEVADPEECQWWTSRQYELLPHRHLWMGAEGMGDLDFFCTSCGKKFEGLKYHPEDTTEPPIQRGGFLFHPPDPNGTWSIPPKVCDKCGGWLQPGIPDFKERVREGFEFTLKRLQEQRLQRVAAEPTFSFYNIRIRLMSTKNVEEILEFPEFFQILDAVLPTIPYDKWAEIHHCDLISAQDAIIVVSMFLCAVADYLLTNMLELELKPIPERVDFLAKCAAVSGGGLEHAQSTYEKLAIGQDWLFYRRYNDSCAGRREFFRTVSPALKVFQVMGLKDENGQFAELEECHLRTSQQYELLPHRHLWIGEGITSLDVFCISCRKRFNGLKYHPEDTTEPPIQRGGFLFHPPDPNGTWSIPPKVCDECGGWLQPGIPDFKERVREGFEFTLKALRKQQSERVQFEPVFSFSSVRIRLMTMQNVEELLGFPELFQILNAVLPTIPYNKWAENHHCDLISAEDAFRAVSIFLVPVADYLLTDMFASKLNPIPERVDFLANCAAVSGCGPEFARSVYGKLACGQNWLFHRRYGGSWHSEFERTIVLALKVFKVMGFRIYTW
eukprot:Skav226886  [mRNA]  locus=scaffold1187:455899:457827:+ [translate_table: standard]